MSLLSQQTTQKDTVSFHDIKTQDQLLAFLTTRAETHPYLFQYTNLNTLEGMLQNKQLYLSRADRLNDVYEGGQIGEKRNVFIASFSHVSSERIAMWSMYAFPYDQGVRLKIDGKAMQAILKGFRNTKRVFLPALKRARVIPYTFSGNVQLYLVDVVYTNGKRLKYYKEKINKTTDLLSKDIRTIDSNNINNGLSLLNWCIKDDLWEPEIETRLILVFDKPIPEEKLAIDISEAIPVKEVMCGPCLYPPSIDKYLQQCGQDNVIESKYYNGTFFKSCNKEKCNPRTLFCKNRNPTQTR